jgi:hypothetical protein
MDSHWIFYCWDGHLPVTCNLGMNDDIQGSIEAQLLCSMRDLVLAPASLI